MPRHLPTPAVDQLTKFNQRLADLCPDPTQRHLIDGIVLTKFDTIDDKVGCSGRDGGRVDHEGPRVRRADTQH